MNDPISSEFEETLKLMMAIAGVANRLGLDPRGNIPIYEAWSMNFPMDAYSWLSMSVLKLAQADIEGAKALLAEAIVEAETNREYALDAYEWLNEEFPEKGI